MTDNLGAGRIGSALASGQWAKADDMAGALDAALTEGPLSVSFVAGSPANTVTLTAAQFIGNVAFRAVAGSPGPSGACTLNVPPTNAQATTLKRGFFAVINDLGVDLTVQKSGGQSETAPTLSTGQRSILYFDGSNVYLAVPQGTVGADGADGTDPGLLYDFDTTTADADPGAGKLRANNADLSAATQLFIDDVDRSASDHAAFINSWDDSSNTVKGHVLLKRASDDDTAVFSISAITDAAGYVKVTVAHVSGVTSFSAADVISVQFFRAGDAGTGSTAGKHTIWIPSSAMLAATTSGPASAQVETATNDINVQVLDFDAAADEHAHFHIAFPKSWDEGTVTFQVWWTTTATDTDGVAWALQAVAVSDNEAADASWGTAVVVTDDAQGAASEILVSAESGPVTVGGTPAAGDICFFRLFRDVGDANDDMTEDARLIGIKLFYTTDADTDA